MAKNKEREYFNFYISYLKEYLGISPDKYKIIKDFKRRILEPAYLELKEKADICFEIDWSTKVKNNEKKIGVLKNGRIITGYRIRIINHKAKSLTRSKQSKVDHYKVLFPTGRDKSTICWQLILFLVKCNWS